VTSGPALVSILRQGSYLVASVHTALDDSEMIRFQNDLIAQIGKEVSVRVALDKDAAQTLREQGKPL